MLQCSLFLVSFLPFFAGKEAIATVGVRIGRTAAHVALYLGSALLGGGPPQRALMGVALAAAAVWAVTLGKVDALASQLDDSPLPSPAPPAPAPPPPPSKRQEVVGVLPAKLGVDGNGSYTGGASAESGAGTEGLRRRGVKGGGADRGISALNGNTARTDGDTVTQKDLEL